ncbi:N-acetylmuramoyl-L-alanine amidase [Sphingobacterium sp. UT-1RO-CII-1]|uniref:N-acetylmuramoyl-L-alanine amidase family protein n=1 Tax=Sphingobacterium sp. UT-1RO-CII-1 TaxID=2995225 RepID=UPI00227CB3C0|nr:N-acetylmuramoyl-L-alanine amidase [Sphingobacterium sp. UT-1RO-CII-1]MCY4779757.1 N-acetylmuramoyl-L-alanine amidase [Sphingobacterium sp. UT-1RO-CII-1]
MISHYFTLLIGAELFQNIMHIERESKLRIIKKKFTLLLLFFVAAIYNISAATKGLSINEPYIIVIDPGHGGGKIGAKGRKSTEKDIVLDISKKLKTLLEAQIPNAKVLLTRTTDIDVTFLSRIQLANKNKANIFISIHANSADVDIRVRNKNGKYVNSVRRNPKVRGTETLVLGFHRMAEQDVAIRENADLLLEDNYKEDFSDFNPSDPSSYIIFQLMRNQYRRESIKLASLIQGQYVKSAKIDRGVKEQGLAVLSKATMPAVLTEIGFISSPEEEEYMLSAKGQEEIAQNLTNAIKMYKEHLKI